MSRQKSLLYIALMFSCWVSISGIQAQSTSFIGGGGGGNISHFNGSRWTIFYQKQIKSPLFFKSAITYVRKVNNYPHQAPDQSVETLTTDSDYLECDIAIQVNMDFQKDVNLTFTTGPYFGLVRRHSIRYYGEAPTANPEDLDLSNWDWGWLMEGGIQKSINKKTWVFTSFRWEVGAHDLISDQSFTLRNEDKMLTLGMLFALN